MSYNTNLQNKNNSLRTILNKINSLPEASSGVELPELTNPATANDLLAEKELIDGDGNIITGTFTIDDEIATQDDLIAQIQSTVDSLPEADSGTFTLQSKSVTPTTNTQTITADDGYDGLDTVTVDAIPSTYVKPTSTKEATTYTPTTTAQTIASGTYCSGAQTIKGDANLIASNIKSGVSIFGVNGTFEADAGGSAEEVETCMINIGVYEGPSGGPPLDFPLTYHYLDKNFTPISIEISTQTTIEVIKNSIIYILHWSNMMASELTVSNTMIELAEGYDVTSDCSFGTYIASGSGNLLAT